MEMKVCASAALASFLHTQQTSTKGLPHTTPPHAHNYFQTNNTPTRLLRPSVTWMNAGHYSRQILPAQLTNVQSDSTMSSHSSNPSGSSRESDSNDRAPKPTDSPGKINDNKTKDMEKEKDTEQASCIALIFRRHHLTTFAV